MPRNRSSSSLDRWSADAGWAETYYRWLRANTQLLMGVWLLCAAAAWLSGQDALSYVTTKSEGPASTPGAMAKQALGLHFPQLLLESALVTVRCVDGCDVFNTQVEKFVTEVEEGLDGFYLPVFSPPISLFSVLPPGEEISGSAADIQLQHEVEAARAQAAQAEEQLGETQLTPGVLNATVADARSILAHNGSRRDAELAALQRMREANAAFGAGFQHGRVNLSSSDANASEARPPVPLQLNGAPPEVNAGLARLSVNGTLLPAARQRAVDNLTRPEQLLSYMDAFERGVQHSVNASATRPAEEAVEEAVRTAGGEAAGAVAGGAEAGSGALGALSAVEAGGGAEVGALAGLPGAGFGLPDVGRQLAQRDAPARRLQQARSTSAAAGGEQAQPELGGEAGGGGGGEMTAEQQAMLEAAVRSPRHRPRISWPLICCFPARQVLSLSDVLGDSFHAALHSEAPVHIPVGTAQSMRDACAEFNRGDAAPHGARRRRLQGAAEVAAQSAATAAPSAAAVAPVSAAVASGIDALQQGGSVGAEALPGALQEALHKFSAPAHLPCTFALRRRAAAARHRAAERRLGGRELAARQRRARPLARVDRGRRRARGLDRADARALPLATFRGLAWRAGGRRAQHGGGAGCKRWARCMIPKHGTAHHALQVGHSCAEAACGSLCASPFAPTVTASPFHLSPAGGSPAQAVPGGGRLAHTHIGAARARVR